FVANPAPADVAASSTEGTLVRSGAINYLNEFGKIETVYEFSDTVSELYYVGLSSLKHHRLESVYLDHLPFAAGESDGFPVLMNALRDRIEYTCQGNAIVTIGDSHTWHDTAIPGSALSFLDPINQVNHAALPPLAASGSDPGLDTKRWLSALGNLPLVE